MASSGRAHGGGEAGASWRRVGAVEPAALVDSRLELHYAAQALASFGQALIEPRDDDSHRSMAWDRGERTLSSEESAEGLRVRLRVPAFRLEVEREGEAVGGVDLAGMRPSEVLESLGEELSRKGGADVSLEWPEYDLPERADGSDAALRPDGKAVDELSIWFDDAAGALAREFGGLREASPIRCWPHHFDLAILLTYPEKAERGETSYVGAGLSPGDEGRSEPYYYVNGWPAPDPDDLPKLHGPGIWNTEGWVGGVLEAAEIVAAGSANEQARMVEAFLSTTAETMRRALATGPSNR